MKIKTILLVCVLVMATNSMVYANEEEGNEKIYYSEKYCRCRNYRGIR